VIVAHHAGEHLILMLAGSGAGAGPLLLVVWRARLGRMVDRIRRR
jgi:hypothetical protein